MKKPNPRRDRAPPTFLRNADAVFSAMERKLARMSQTRLARECGLSVQSICDVVKRRRAPPDRLLEVLGFETAYVRLKRPPGVAVPPASDSAPAS